MNKGSTDVQRLIDGLSSRSARRLDEVRARLVSMGERVVEPLIAALEDGPTCRRVRVMGLLALTQDPRALRPLIARLGERSVLIRESAARSLGRFFTPEAVEALERTMLNDRRESVRVCAVIGLVEQYSAGQEPAIRLVLRALTDVEESTEVRLAATQLLRALRRSQREAWLERLIEDHDERIARRAAELKATLELERGGKKRNQRIDHLIDALASEDYTRWNGAAEQLGKRGIHAVAPLVAEMQRRAHDPEFCRRAGIVFGVLGPRYARQIGDALPALEEPLPIQVLVEVIDALGVKAQIYRLADLIERIADRPESDFDPMQRARALAHLALARIGSRVAIDDLRAFVADPDRRCELEMIEALARIGNREELRILLSAWIREDASTRKRIGEAILKIMRRERIRRNSVELKSLPRAEKRALRTILPPAANARVAVAARRTRARSRMLTP